ncbi:hypothetical protein [Photobacterium chitinilyticum]|uniref:Uncharacterized protein n=1 Tax=Photobacterium chitinilyticum TaxID=2485123 RepID=A0A3S3S246_9GAMM|nr:hypothetical protein [Photobacterium chitinilyticum]RWX56226.1 hypothetical protein EDI28_08055 [Photobacterium chitinilyticum]
MATENLSNIISTLLTAPADAVVQASATQRYIWMKWLTDLTKLIKGEPEDVSRKIINEHLKLAPSWKMSAQLSLSLSMRIASIERTEGGVSLGLGIGMIHGSGSFGFTKETTTESTLQAQAIYNLTNDTETSLKDYLNMLGINTLDNTGDLDNAIKKLGKINIPHTNVAQS